MSAHKHTPGPWNAVHYYDEDEEVTVTDSDGFEHVTAESVAILSSYSEKLGISHWADSPGACREISVEEQNANAHLIAAAPDLLEALVYARRFLRPEDHDTGYVDAAIAKAFGGAA